MYDGSVTAGGRRHAKTVRAAALAVAATHLAAAVAAFVFIRPGREPETTAERAAFVASHATTWSAAWLLFSVAAVTMVWLAVAMRRLLDPERTRISLDLGAALVGLGAALEIVGHCVSAGVLPVLAAPAAGVTEPTTYRAVERGLDFVMSVGGQLGFALGVLLFVIELHRRALVHRGVTMLGFVNAGCGGVLLVAGAVGSAPASAGAATAVLITVIAFALALSRSAWLRPAG
jgi:hypothetical protein